MTDSKQDGIVSMHEAHLEVMPEELSAFLDRRLAELIRDVGLALVQSTTLDEMAQQCTQALVHHFDAAFARIWTLNDEENVLELRASAGMYTHLNGPHSRVPLGALKIGLIASERLPHLTNSVVGDPRVSDQAWAIREGMVAFAGYPLLVSERIVGVMALFARHPLSPSVLDTMTSIANTIAVGLDRKQGEEARLRLFEAEQQARRTAE
ncbi:MAG: GAF domain-containing protein, partial [Ktedonobacteraceae bacterium]|nr:GAF domain-containing protein [Ktedonobacteraceae bacterium]